MSDQKLDDSILAEIEEYSSISIKKTEIDQFQTDAKYKRMKRSKDRLEAFNNFSLSQAFNSEAHLEKMKQGQKQRAVSFKNRLPFIHDQLTQMITLAAQEFIFIGGKTGRGKSTTIANVIIPFIKIKKKVLVISNEEMAVSILNRAICITRGWNINEFKSFTQEQLDYLDKARAVLNKFVHVVDAEFILLPGATRSKEGLKAILEQATKEKYGLILIDYFQKFSESEEESQATKVQNLTDIVEYLDAYVKRTEAPVVLMGQLKTEGKDRPEFEDRVKECKAVVQNCTQAYEIITDKELLKTTFISRKDRWNESDNRAVEMGFSKGRYVPYTDEFKAEVAHSKMRKEEKQEEIDMLKGIE